MIVFIHGVFLYGVISFDFPKPGIWNAPTKWFGSLNERLTYDSVSTRTLHSDDLELVHENDRIFANNSYLLPCDQGEQDRLAILHQVFFYALKGELCTTKITSSMRRILDLGTGPGEWAVAMSQKYPHIEVVGIDLAVWDLEATEGSVGEGRVTWEIDDLDVWAPDHQLEDLTGRLEILSPFGYPRHLKQGDLKGKGKLPLAQAHIPDEIPFDPSVLEQHAQVGWHFSEPFDFVHMRGLKGAFAYWEDVYAEIYKNLNPGGFVEVVDLELTFPDLPSPSEPGAASAPSAGESGPDPSALPAIRALYKSLMTASFKCGRPLGTFYMHPSYLEDAGFKDVRTTYVNVPVGTWPDDPEQKRIGKMFLVVLMESLEPYSLRLLSKYGDSEKVWTAEEIRAAVEVCKKEILEWENRVQRDGASGWCATFKWMVGRKSKNA